ncbi:hypothetical protein Pyn_23602 [Prunus yedoensis var. nudiflora]|uniref:DNA polymerase II subunit 2 n=1 Tax=Prunus yedoensis var. nudiflora TaxID=2094558 RepID=A0A314V2L2_PRUYE|nr:hypothetical protein Pyn_23602 [Prunus yedoensis var. nudiflora]
MLRLAKLEREAVNGNVVILSDIWLDNEEVMGKLERVLDAFENEDFVPSQFGKLGQMIAAHPRLKEGSCFLFIPGPDDAGPSTVLPRPSLPKYLREELQNHIPNAIFSSNPCRQKSLLLTWHIGIHEFKNEVLWPGGGILPSGSAVQNAPFMSDAPFYRRNY